MRLHAEAGGAGDELLVLLHGLGTSAAVRFPAYQIERAVRGGRARIRGFGSLCFTGGPNGS